jgi:trimeric autotransporter adhesin
MTVPITLTNLANLNNPTTAVNTINSNNTAIASAFSSALYTVGDQMLGVLDMNSNQIINLPAPSTINSPVRLIDVNSTAAVAVTSGVSALLAANNTWTGTNTYSSAVTFAATTLTATTPNFITPAIDSATGSSVTLTGFISAPSAVHTTITGISSLVASSAAITTITGISSISATSAAITTITGVSSLTATSAAITTITGVSSLTVTTFSAATLAATTGLLGITTGATVAAGYVGEYIQATTATVALSSAATSTITNIALSAGEWDVSFVTVFSESGISSVNYLAAGMSTSPSVATGVGMSWQWSQGMSSFGGSGQFVGVSPIARFTGSAGFTVYGSAVANYTGGSMTSVNSVLRARRMH